MTASRSPSSTVRALSTSRSSAGAWQIRGLQRAATLADLLTGCGLRTVRQDPVFSQQREPRDMRIVGEK